ncbi:hypothetical protein ABPG72_001580 [Tetrahymena utriculariae]
MKTQFLLFKIIFQLFISQNLLVFFRADEILFAQEYDNTSPINDYKQMKCDNGFWYEYSQKYIVGKYSSTDSNPNPITRTYSSLPPHWSIAFSFDLILFNILNWSNDKLQILADNNVQNTYQKESINPSRSFCTNSYYDTLKLYHVNITHSSPTVQIFIKSSFSSNKSGYGIRNIILHVEKCYQSCFTCKGPTSDDCLSCSNNFSLVGSTCKCANGYFEYQNTCLQQCPQGYNQNPTNGQCEYDKCNSINCQTCNSSPKKQCLTCKSGFYLHIDQCVSSCPLYAPLNSNILKSRCFFASPACFGKYALRGLFSQTFGESEIQGMNLQTVQFYGNRLENNSPSNQVFTNCGGVQLFGGANLASSKSQIVWKSSNLYTNFLIILFQTKKLINRDPHYKLTISFTVYLIDSWDNEEFYLKIDGTKIFSQQYDYNTFKDQICGLSEYKDKKDQVQKTISHNTPTVEVIISSALDETPYNESFGIRDLYILLEACIDNCQQCNNNTQCQKCMEGYGLYNSLCYQPCPDSFWNNQGICTACDASCLKCNGSGSNSCTACKTGTFLYNNKCVNPCPDTLYYPDPQNNVCKPCDKSCQKCQYPGDQKSCTQCKPTFLLNGECLNNCPDQYYKSGNVCIPCDSTCLTCSGPNPNQCITCLSPKKLQTRDNTCSLTCPDTDQYQDSNKCINCDSSCASCSAAGSSACTKCKNPNFLDTNKCVPSCSDGKFADLSDRTCKKCDSNCLTCSNSSIQCLTCQKPLILQPKNKQCVQNCDDGQYFDSTSNSCLPCDSNCKGCVNSSKQCTSCNPPNYLKLSACTNDCGNNQFGDSTDQKCKPCNSTCLTCSGPNDNQCITCVPPLLFYQVEKQCKQACRDDQYLDKTSCIQCNKDCYSCSGPNNNQCLSCNPPKILQGTQCQGSCDNGFYAINNTKCQPCDPNCLTCVNSSTECIICPQGKLLDTISKKCVSQCQDGQYQDQSNKACKPCDTNCKTCQGPLVSDCLSCKPPQVLQGTKCQQNCDKGYYYSSSSQKCLICDQNCETCQNDSTQCLTCQNVQFLDQVRKKCISQCQNDQYFDQKNQTCFNCDKNCQTCKGPQSTDCKSCFPPNVLQGINCQQKCNDGFFYSLSDQKCMPCDSNCQTCSVSQIQCSTCPQNQYLDTVTKKYVSKCSDNSYQDNSINSCYPCISICKTCSGSSSSDCLSCSPPNVLQVNKCQAECDKGYFYSSADNKCMKCDLNCKTCENKSAECLTCPPTKILDSVTKTCVNNCASNQYQDMQSISCKVCDKTCKTCSGPTSQNCLTCESQFYLVNGKCVPVCTLGFFQDKGFACKPCDQSCTSCNQQSNNCQTCRSAFILNKQQCVANCNSDQYVDLTKNECVQCNLQCRTCTGPSNNQCLSCPQGKYLVGSVCSDACQEKQYIENNVCKSCHQTCESCTGEKNNQCTKCPKVSYFYKNICISQCPEDLFQDENKNECAKCHESCSNNGCYGPNINQCKKENFDFKRSLIVMIVTGKTIFWLVSCITGFILDRRDKRFYSNKVQSIKEEQINESPRDLEKKQELKEDVECLDSPEREFAKRRKRQKFLQSQITSLNVTSANVTKDQIQPQDSQINNLNLSPHRSRRARSKIAILLSQINTFQDLNQCQDSDSQVVTDLSPTIKKQRIKSNLANEQNSPFCSKVYPEQSKQNDKFYESNQKFKYTIIGNELISLFKFYDRQIGRIFRSTLIYIKYLSFLFATEFVFQNGNIILLIPSIFFGLAVKFILYQILTSLHIFLRYGAIFASLLLIGASASDIYLWFLPIIKDLYWNKDFTWSIFYAAVFSVDLIIIQQIISLFKYLSSVRSLNVKGEFWQNVLNKFLTSRAFILKIKNG